MPLFSKRRVGLDAVWRHHTVWRHRDDPSRVAPTQRYRPLIGHMKTDGRLDRNSSSGRGAINALLCGAGYNLRKILRKLRLLYAFILAALLNFSIAADLMV